MEVLEMLGIVFVVLLVTMALALYGKVHRLLNLHPSKGRLLVDVNPKVQKYLMAIAVMVILSISGVLWVISGTNFWD